MRLIRQRYAGARRATAIAIYQALTEIASDAGSSTQLEAPIKRIGEYAGAAETTVKRYLHEFEELELVEKQAQVIDGAVNLPNRYFLVTPGASRAGNGSEPPGSTGGPTPGSTGRPTPRPEGSSPNTPLGEEKSNNNAPAREEEGEESVVVALIAFGVSRRVAEDLASRYSEEYIREKLRQASFLVARKSPLVAKNPAGYLRRAIEEDYLPPAGFQAAAAAPTMPRRDEADVSAEHERAALESRRRRQEQRERVLQVAGETAQEPEWQQTHELLRRTSSPTVFTWLSGAVLVREGEEHALVVLPTRYGAEWAQRKVADIVAQALSCIVGSNLQVSFIDYAGFLEAREPTLAEVSEAELLHSPPMLKKSPVGGQPASKEIATGSAAALPQRSGE